MPRTLSTLPLALTFDIRETQTIYLSNMEQLMHATITVYNNNGFRYIATNRIKTIDLRARRET